MSELIFFSLAFIMVVAIGRIFWQGFRTIRAALILEAELRVHWRQIYPQGKEWNYLWYLRNWRKIIGAELLMRYPQFNNALSQYEQQSSEYGRELLYFILISPLALGLAFVIALIIETSNR